MVLSSYGIRGRIVTMTAEDAVIKDGTVYIVDTNIAAIVKAGDPVPATCTDLPVINSGCTIFPGMIELHNHLSYNCLPLWNVPKKFGNRGQWGRVDAYQELISGPMKLLGKTPGYVEAIVRYVECKCLMAGVTTSQGIMLFSNAGIRKYYRGIVRNVEDGMSEQLPNVDAHIPDIASKDAAHFLTQLNKSTCLLLHLAEGADESARTHFESLRIDKKNWAITSALTGIHCGGLMTKDYTVMKKLGASMVWSPLSNLLLYGATAKIKAAKQKGIKIGLGSDWSPSGSKNLLGELKAAKVFSDNSGKIFTDYELICMATKNAAEIIHWEERLGTLENGKLADLFLVTGIEGNPYNQLLHATESDINMVVIDGTPRLGTATLMKIFGKGSENRKLGKQSRVLNLKQETQNSIVGKLKLSQAEKKLKGALKNLNDIARQTPPLQSVGFGNDRILMPATAIQKTNEPTWVLVLDHDEEEGEPMRPHLPGDNEPTMTISTGVAGASLPKEFPVIELDPLTVTDDKKYFTKLTAAINLPAYMKSNLPKFYQSAHQD